MNNLPPGCTNADIDAAAGHDERACDGTEACRCRACEADAEIRDLEDQAAAQTDHALNAIMTAMSKPAADEAGDTRVCDQCGTDQVADLSWPVGYSDPRHYPPHYCSECGPTGIVTSAEFDRRQCKCCEDERAIADGLCTNCVGREKCLACDEWHPETSMQKGCCSRLCFEDMYCEQD